jgi:hypothetical protein
MPVFVSDYAEVFAWFDFAHHRALREKRPKK